LRAQLSDAAPDRAGVETGEMVEALGYRIRRLFLGVFMVGAYQEILGDMHNLFGDTDSVDVDIGPAGAITLSHPIHGDSVRSVLRYVNFDPDRLLETLERHCHDSTLDEHERGQFIAEIRDGLDGYTYLE